MNCLCRIVPFRAGNRRWLLDLCKAYAFCLLIGTFLAAMLNLFEGDYWLGKKKTHIQTGQVQASGDTAMDECLWFVFTTMHGVNMDDFMPKHVYGRYIGAFLACFSYWFPIYMMSIVLLYQLPGEKALGAFGVFERLVQAVWPSYLFLLLAACSVSAYMGTHISHDSAGFHKEDQWLSAMYCFWTIVHRQPFGDIFPNDPMGRTITVPAAIVSNLYIPYALALVAVRKPTSEQHESLLEYLSKRPEEALGRGYTMPNPTYAPAIRELRPSGEVPTM